MQPSPLESFPRGERMGLCIKSYPPSCEFPPSFSSFLPSFLPSSFSCLALRTCPFQDVRGIRPVWLNLAISFSLLRSLLFIRLCPSAFDSATLSLSLPPPFLPLSFSSILCVRGCECPVLRFTVWLRKYHWIFDGQFNFWKDCFESNEAVYTDYSR